MWIYDVDVVHSDAMKIKETREYLVIKGVVWGPLGALVGPSWGPVGAYPFDMFKNEESSATAGKQRPAVGGGASGGTLSKQVYLGRDLKSSRSPNPLRYGSALRPKGLRGRI